MRESLLPGDVATRVDARGVAELLAELRARDIRYWVDEGHLRVNGPRGALDPALREELARRRDEILAFLGAAGAVTPPPLRPAGPGGRRPLSFAQERLWFLQKLDPESPAYNLQALIPLTGDWNAAALERAVGEVMRRHEVLRSRFVETDGQPEVVIAEPAPVRIPVVDLGGEAPAARAEALRRVATEQARERFDLAAGPLLRLVALRLGEGSEQLLLTHHHVITDGWSIALLIREVIELYAGYRVGRTVKLPELPFQYSDYARAQREWLQGEALDAYLAYWRRQLAGPVPALELPSDRPRPPVQSLRGATHHFRLEAGLRDRVAALSRAEGATPFMTLLAAFQLLLARYSGQQDFAVGTASGNRTWVETEALVGLFVNTLVLRTDLTGDPSFREALGRARRVTLEAQRYSDLPFEKLVEELRPERDLSRAPLVQALLVLQNTPLQALADGTDARQVLGDRGTAVFDLSLYLIEDARGYAASLEYSTDLFDAGTAERLCRHYATLLAEAVATPERACSALALLDADERREVLESWNDTARPLPEGSVVDWFEAQAARTPDAIALVFEAERLSYAALDERASRLASRLRSLGVGPETLVGLCVDRGPAMLVALLGILKSGGAYLPLDPAYPPERLALMLDDSGASLLLTEEALLGSLPGGRHTALCLDREAGWPDPAPGSRPRVHPDQLAYTIYTSGSTGRPKGVQVSHAALANLLESMRSEPGLTSRDCLLAVTTLSFDIAGLELYLPLVAGARLALATREVASDGARLLGEIGRSGATLMQATPATWRLLLEAGWTGEPALRALCGGEALPGSLADEIRGRAAGAWNLYGPTEATIWSAVHVLGEDAAPNAPLGRPIANTRIHVLDPRLEPVPPGVAGELYIGGVGLARGYWGRPGLTAERFVPDPHAPAPGARLYRTGDLARYRPDGVLEFLGRVDQQIKLRGFRIELGEIEEALRDHTAVAASAVVERSRGPGDQQLVAYVVYGDEGEPTATELRRHLKQKLPPYMIPSAFVGLDALPLTPNGKVDRRALAGIGSGDDDSERRVIAPRTPAEERVARVWCEALGVEAVSVQDNFFDIGGHSLLSMRVIARLESELGVRIHPREMVFQTLEQLAAMCEERSARALEGSAR